MASKRLYITLNTDKEKDQLIIEFLNKKYNDTDYIKALLYSEALKVQNDSECTKTVQKGAERCSLQSKDIELSDSECSEKVQKGAECTKTVQVDNDIMSLFN